MGKIMEIRCPYGKLEFRQIKKEIYELIRLKVHPDHRKKGIATKLLKHFLDCHSGTIYADVYRTDYITKKILKKFNFKKDGKSSISYCERYVLENIK